MRNVNKNIKQHPGWGKSVQCQTGSCSTEALSQIRYQSPQTKGGTCSAACAACSSVATPQLWRDMSWFRPHRLNFKPFQTDKLQKVSQHMLSSNPENTCTVLGEVYSCVYTCQIFIRSLLFVVKAQEKKKNKQVTAGQPCSCQMLLISEPSRVDPSRPEPST